MCVCVDLNVRMIQWKFCSYWIFRINIVDLSLKCPEIVLYEVLWNFMASPTLFANDFLKSNFPLI